MLGTSDKMSTRPSWPTWIVKPHNVPLPSLDPPKEGTIRIVAGTREPSGLEARIDVVDLAKSRFFTIIDLSNGEIVHEDVVKNEASPMPKAALVVAYWLVSIGTNITIASGYCHNMSYFLDQAGVTRLICEENTRVIECLKKLGLVKTS